MSTQRRHDQGKTNAVEGLSAFEGRDVVLATIKVTNAGDGLSDAMSIEPVEMHHGEKRYLLIEAEVTRVHYDELKDTDVLKRVHTLKAGTATLVSAEFAVGLIEAQRKAILSAKGVEEFDFTDEEIAEQAAKEQAES